MLFIRHFLTGLLVLLALGCAATKPDLAGTYITEVSQSSVKSTIVGELELNPSGQYQAMIGQLPMSGTWKAGNGQVFLTGTDEASKFLPTQYRIDGNRLIAQFEGVDAKHWRFVKTESKLVANR